MKKNLIIIFFVLTFKEKYIALLIENLNYDNSISKLLDPADRIKNIVSKYNEGK